MYRMNIAVTARSKACACRRSLAGIVCSNPPGTGMFVFYECCLLSCRGLCVGLMNRPEESSLVFGVSNECDS
jgi:hypothetical protein